MTFTVYLSIFLNFSRFENRQNQELRNKLICLFSSINGHFSSLPLLFSSLVVWWLSLVLCFGCFFFCVCVSIVVLDFAVLIRFWCSSVYMYKDVLSCWSLSHLEKSKMTQTDRKIYHVLELEKSLLTKSLYYPRQSTDSVQSLSNYQWHFSQN